MRRAKTKTTISTPQTAPRKRKRSTAATTSEKALPEAGRDGGGTATGGARPRRATDVAADGPRCAIGGNGSVDSAHDGARDASASAAPTASGASPALTGDAPEPDRTPSAPTAPARLALAAPSPVATHPAAARRGAAEASAAARADDATASEPDTTSEDCSVFLLVRS